MITIDKVRKYALSLPESREVEHWSKPSFRINNKIFAVIQEDGITLTIKTVGEDRMIYTTMDPNTYRIPDSFSNLNYMHVNLCIVEPEELKGLVFKAWSAIAPKRLLKTYAEGQLQDDEGIT